MEGDFNIKEKTYAYMAQGKERPDFGALRPKAFDLFLKIQTSVSQNLIQVSKKTLQFSPFGRINRKRQYAYIPVGYDIVTKTICTQWRYTIR